MHSILVTISWLCIHNVYVLYIHVKKENPLLYSYWIFVSPSSAQYKNYAASYS